jgi:prepilin-type N-terminal cleavage/methylation domain-containing protein
MKKGFTLIELLVVIAIIGILSSVVLASLNSARAKGSDAAVKSGLANLRAQAELFYDGNGQSYSGVCTSTQFATMLASATTTGGSGACFNDANNWSASAGLKGVTGKFWCVGNSGASKQVDAEVTAANSCI